jgi:hypothetical protein
MVALSVFLYLFEALYSWSSYWMVAISGEVLCTYHIIHNVVQWVLGARHDILDSCRVALCGAIVASMQAWQGLCRSLP